MKDKQQKIGEVLSQLFRPQRYNTQLSLQKLNSCGGILSIINHLKTCHRRGLSSNDMIDHEKRVEEFGKNKAPYGQSVFKRSVLQQRDFIINLLFYLLTLRICVKLLLFRDQIRGLHPLGEQPFHLRINTQLISYLLLIGIILLKAQVSVEYHKMDPDQRKYKNQRITVKRDGQQQIIYQQNLMVGDILVVQTNTAIRIDGIIIKSKNFVVSQAHTVLRQDTKAKKQIWAINLQEEFCRSDDPFILAGSYVVTGSAQILVCTVGSNCSFRRDKLNKGYYNEYTTKLTKIKYMMNYVEDIAKIITLFLATCKSIQYLYIKYIDIDNMSWIDLLYILKVYCGYIGLICFVQRLKILKSLQFFIQVNCSDKYYRIKNRDAFEQLSKLQILFIQSNTLAIKSIMIRDQQKIQIQHIAQISQLNNFCQIKIITSDTRQRVAQIFGNDINYHSYFQPNQQITYNNHVKSLVQATFITSTSVNTFINEYLPIYRALNYNVGYIYDSTNINNHDIPKQVLQISFQRLNMNTMESKHSKLISELQDNTSSSTFNNFNNFNKFWIKIQNKVYMQQQLLGIFMKSHIYASLFNTYMALFVNNVLVFIVLSLFSTFVNIINLSWYLLIIIAHRYLFFIVYSRTTKYKRILSTKQNSHMEIFKLNLFLFPYYLYVANRLQSISSLFMFFLVNGMLRIQVILLKKLPMDKIQLFKNIAKYLATYILIKGLVLYLEKDQTNFIQEQINSIKCTSGLLIIYIGYALFF